MRRTIDTLTDLAMSRGHARRLEVPEVTELPAELTLQDGRSVYEKPAGPRYATDGQVRAERAIQEAAVERGAPALSQDATRQYVDQLAGEGLELGADQRRAVEPINREKYRVAEIREDGSLVGEREDGSRIALPTGYVAERFTLGYASTVHSAQGMTVDTTHAVITPRTGSAAYVAMSRGRDRNTAYVQTVHVPEDSPPGQVSTTECRPAASVLADVIEREQEDSASATEVEAQSWAAATSTKTAGERMTDAAELIATARTSSALDQLAATGRLTEVQRRELAADQATGQLSRLLRRVELSGHDPAQALDAAAGSGRWTPRHRKRRCFTGASRTSSVVPKATPSPIACRAHPTRFGAGTSRAWLR